MAILTSKKIESEIKNSHIRISGFNKSRLGPNSYDLTLMNKVSYYDIGSYSYISSNENILDPKSPCELITEEIPEDGFILLPNKLYLCETNERVFSDKYVVELSGISSLARFGIEVHQTAGYANIGHDFKWVLEITVVHPIKIYPNMRIAQMYFHTVDGDIELYNGRYKYLQMDSEICPSHYENDNIEIKNELVDISKYKVIDKETMNKWNEALQTVPDAIFSIEMLLKKYGINMTFSNYESIDNIDTTPLNGESFWNHIENSDEVK